MEEIEVKEISPYQWYFEYAGHRIVLTNWELRSRVIERRKKILDFLSTLLASLAGVGFFITVGVVGRAETIDYIGTDNWTLTTYIVVTAVGIAMMFINTWLLNLIEENREIWVL